MTSLSSNNRSPYRYLAEGIVINAIEALITSIDDLLKLFVCLLDKDTLVVASDSCAYFDNK